MTKRARKRVGQTGAQGAGTVSERPVAEVPMTHGPIVPRSVAGLTGQAKVRVEQLQALAVERALLAGRIDAAALAARKAGASWSGIGWAVGTTGQAARKRWADA